MKVVEMQYFGHFHNHHVVDRLVVVVAVVVEEGIELIANGD
jgi:hypothetical protein